MTALERAAVYVNVDTAVFGMGQFSASASQSLAKAVHDAAGKVPDPANPGQMLNATFTIASIGTLLQWEWAHKMLTSAVHPDKYSNGTVPMKYRKAAALVHSYFMKAMQRNRRRDTP